MMLAAWLETDRGRIDVQGEESKPRMHLSKNPNHQVEEGAFPTGTIVVDVYRAVISDFGYALRISWAWILVAASALVAADLLLGEAFSSKANRDAVADWSSFAVVLIYALPLASIAVAWHRWLLLKEKDPSRIYLRLDGTVLNYLGFAVLVQFIAWSPYILPWLLRRFFKLIIEAVFGFSNDRVSAIEYVLSDQGLLASPIVQIFAFVAFLVFALRFGLVLPAKAIGLPGVSLKAAWQATRGQTFGLVVGLLLSVLPVVLAFVGLRLAGFDFSAEDGSVLHVSDRLMFVMFQTLLGLVQVAFLSYSFLFFFPPDNTPATT